MKNKISALREDINIALVDVAKKHGMSKLLATQCKFMSDSCTFTVVGVVEGGLSKEAERYEAYRESMHLPPLNTEMLFGKDTFKVVGLNSTASKVEAEKMNGRGGPYYLLPTRDVVEAWREVQKISGTDAK